MLHALRISQVGVRGVVGPGLTATHVVEFVAAFAGSLREPGAVVVARDPRASGLMIREVTLHQGPVIGADDRRLERAEIFLADQFLRHSRAPFLVDHGGRDDARIVDSQPLGIPPGRALGDLNTALALRPGFVEAMLDRALIHRALGNPAAARADALAALQWNPSDRRKRELAEQLLKEN